MTERDELKMAAISDIAAHLANVGSKDWAPLREKHKSFSAATWWRLVAAVKEGKPHTEILAGAIKKAKMAIRRNLPAPVSPEYFAKGGSAAVANVDFLAQFQQLFLDVGMLRAWSVSTDEAGKEKIKNPMYFAKQISLARELMDTFMKVAREVYELQRSKEAWQSVIDEITAESPECARRIMKRLAKLNAERGLTVHAEAS